MGGSLSVVRIATRRSPLALWQAEHVAAALRHAHPDLTVELVPMTTQGDRIQDRPLANIGGKGLFIKELEIAIDEGRADLAVHSMKDVPAELPQGMCISAILPRADTRDALISKEFSSLAALPAGAQVGTSSLRRQAQLLHYRPDLRIAPLRGNVDTRLRKLESEGLHAIILASAGLVRLGWERVITERVESSICLPAVGQGAIGIECRAEDHGLQRRLSALNDERAHRAVLAERALARGLGGSCQSPIAALASIDGERLSLEALVAEPDGSAVVRDTIQGEAERAEQLGIELAQRLMSLGAGPLLERLRA